MVIYKKDYKSINQMLKDFDTKPNNQPFCSRTVKTVRGSYFNHYTDYNTACELIRTGWDEGTKMLKKAKKAIKVPENKVTRRSPYGFYPIIPMAMIGNPNSMIYKKSDKTRKIINIYYDTGNLSHVESDLMLKAGALALTYVNELERTGNVDINLYTQAMAEDHDEILRISLRIKDAGKAFSLRRVAFPMIHPAMHRMIVFRAREINEDIKNRWSGYGQTVNPRTYTPDDFILPSTQTLLEMKYNFTKNDYEKYCEIVAKYNKGVTL